MAEQLTQASMRYENARMCQEVMETLPNGKLVARYVCTICGKKTDYKSNTMRHIRVAHTTTTYDCEFCGQSFKWSDSLRKHRRKCTAIPEELRKQLVG